jgi:hypothetical protein
MPSHGADSSSAAANDLVFPFGINFQPALSHSISPAQV